MVRLQLVDGKGLGLIASRPVRARTVLLRDFAMPITAAEREALRTTPLGNKLFRVETGEELRWYFAFGLSAFVNHSSKPNVEKAVFKDALGYWVEIRSLEDISLGQEVCLCYVAPAEAGVLNGN